MKFKQEQRRRNAIYIVPLSIALLFMLLVTGCTTQNTPAASENLPPVEGDSITATDYSDTGNWACVSQNPSMPVDVFLLYPTAYQGDAPLADILDESMRTGADNWLITSGSAFETAGNIYMPYYRQLNAGWILTQPADQQTAYQRGAPKTDALAAFAYYIEHYNNGRPFILASHSQGSAMVKEILFDYFVNNPDIAERMVAAYVIGYSVTEGDFTRNTQMHFAEGADDTGVVISWNTVAPDAQPLAGSVILPECLAINPISWTRTEETAMASDNLGSYMEVDGSYEKVMGLADATVATIGDNYGVVVCSTADTQTYGMPAQVSSVFGTGSFHGNDIQFYYYNLRENAQNRVRAYLSND